MKRLLLVLCLLLLPAALVAAQCDNWLTDCDYTFDSGLDGFGDGEGASWDSDLHAAVVADDMWNSRSLYTLNYYGSGGYVCIGGHSRATGAAIGRLYVKDDQGTVYGVVEWDQADDGLWYEHSACFDVPAGVAVRGYWGNKKATGAELWWDDVWMSSCDLYDVTPTPSPTPTITPTPTQTPTPTPTPQPVQIVNWPTPLPTPTATPTSTPIPGAGGWVTPAPDGGDNPYSFDAPGVVTLHSELYDLGCLGLNWDWAGVNAEVCFQYIYYDSVSLMGIGVPLAPFGYAVILIVLVGLLARR